MIFPGSSTHFKLLRGWQYGLVVAGGHGVDVGLHQAPWFFYRILLSLFSVILRWLLRSLFYQKSNFENLKIVEILWRSHGKSLHVGFLQFFPMTNVVRKVNRALCVPKFETELVSPCDVTHQWPFKMALSWISGSYSHFRSRLIS